ncbi:MAG: Uroporphyrinogen decarboxylase (URO-D) [Smithella sp. PtaU1.Bin162]|nr:MAG: Uroporphyrinogen decarboxylase (URO-D) [Smithella sp. PtaU1.Bin162]
MNTTERIKRIFSFQQTDRLPMLEWGPWWRETQERWQREGLDKLLKDAGEITDHFGLDPFRVFWVNPRDISCPQPMEYGGRLITDERSYRELKKSHLYPRQGFDRHKLEFIAEQQKTKGMALWIWLEGFFWFPRTLLGIESHLYAFYDNPGILHQINQDLVEYHKYIIETICKICVPDILIFAEDLSYNHGPMLSKEHFDTFIYPYYRQIIPLLKSYGIHPMLDSDGDVVPVIPWLKEAGLEGIGPLEYTAGIDVVKIRSDYPDLLLLGGFNKLVMPEGEEAMRREFERLLPVMASGGYILTVDHQTPPEVPLKLYQVYIHLLREYCEKAGTGCKPTKNY